MWTSLTLAAALFASAGLAQFNVTYTSYYPIAYGDFLPWGEHYLLLNVYTKTGQDRQIVVSSTTGELLVGPFYEVYSEYFYDNQINIPENMAFEWVFPFGNYTGNVTEPQPAPFWSGDTYSRSIAHKYPGESVRAAGDECGFLFFEEVENPPVPNLYRIVIAGSDPSGLGPVLFDYPCTAFERIDWGDGGYLPNPGSDYTDGQCPKNNATVIYDGSGQYYESFWDLLGDSRGEGFFGDDYYRWYAVPWAPGETTAATRPPASTMVIDGVPDGAPVYSNWNEVDGTTYDAGVFYTENYPYLYTSNTAHCLPITTNSYTYTFTVTTGVPRTTTDSRGSTTTSTALTTMTTTMNSPEAYSYTRSISSISRLSSISARASSISAASVSRESSRSVALASKASVASTHSVAVVSHSSSLESARSSKTSVQSVHSSTLSENRASRSSVDATHYATLSQNRVSRSSFNEIHYSTLSANRVSRSSVRQSKSDSISSQRSVKSTHSIAVSSSKLAASISRDSARSAATLSKSLASVSRESARSAATLSRSIASVSRASVNSVLSVSRVSHNSVLAASRSERSSSIRSVSFARFSSSRSVASVRSVSDASVASVRSVSSASVASASSASAAAAAAAAAGGAGPGRRAAPTDEDLAMVTPAPVTDNYYYEETAYYEGEFEFDPRDAEPEAEVFEGVEFEAY